MHAWAITTDRLQSGSIPVISIFFNLIIENFLFIFDINQRYTVAHNTHIELATLLDFEKNFFLFYLKIKQCCAGIEDDEEHEFSLMKSEDDPTDIHMLNRLTEL